MRRMGIAAVVMLMAGLAVAEDRLILEDGQVISGTIVSLDGRDVRIRSGDETIRVPRVAIETIERGVGAFVARPSSRPQHTIPEATPELSTWIDLCIENLRSEDEGVRRGAQAAIRVAGSAARPALERVKAESEDVPPTVTRLLEQLERVESRSTRTADRLPLASGWVPVDALVRVLTLREEQIAAFRTTMKNFQSRAAELSRSLDAGEIEEPEADERFQTLRADTERALGETLDETQLTRCLKMLPTRLPTAS